CESCQLASFACLCQWRPQSMSECDFVLLMHRDEVFKPTNTGRLIADIFPENTYAFAWSRTEPSAELLQLLDDPRRQCFIIYPSAESETRAVYSTVPVSDKLPTFIFLDGTWKQSSRMFHLSRWLDEVPVLRLPETLLRSYAVRKSHQDNYLSTVEAAALCLQVAGESRQSETLLDYFALFNLHYLATRGCYTPAVGEVHQRLANKQQMDRMAE
ncbi:MAG TPA: tRNA-uridine aminocarboxypropyltransferase, partial [Cellvibrio sp.]|nr:tRNA-uridine aminocarboxypropyltransferase [Cellvibrio sp.]